MAELTADQKKKRMRTIIIVIVILLLASAATGVYYFFFSDKAKAKKLLKAAEKEKKKVSEHIDDPDKSSEEKPEEKPKQSEGRPSGNDHFPLSKGSVGDNVLYLKRAMNRLLPVGYTKLKEDKLFDQPVYAYLLTNWGTKYYPVTQERWMGIMEASNKVKS